MSYSNKAKRLNGKTNPLSMPLAKGIQPLGDGTAWGGHLPCKQENRWVQFPYPPLRQY